MLLEEVQRLVQNVEGSEGDWIHRVMCVLAATNECTSRGIALDANERFPNTEGEFAGQKTRCTTRLVTGRQISA